MNGTNTTLNGLKLAVAQIDEQLAATVCECAAIIGWPGVFRAVSEAATSVEEGYVAGVAEAAARFVEQHRDQGT